MHTPGHKELHATPYQPGHNVPQENPIWTIHPTTNKQNNNTFGAYQDDESISMCNNTSTTPGQRNQVP